MAKTPRELRDMLEEFETKFIRLCFSDALGRQRNIAIMADQLERALERGVSFDASAVDGFAKVEESDLFLLPDIETFSLLPWRPGHGTVGRLYCRVAYPDGRPFELCGRTLLSDVEAEALKAGRSFLVGPECEFYLFENDEKGYPTKTPFDMAGYFDLAPLDRGENVRRQICLALEEMGVSPERSHHESGPGQNEIDFRCSSPLKAADDMMTFKWAVKAVAGTQGVYASFMPKPIDDRSGSGLHVNLSLFEGGRNLFEGFAASPDPKAASFMAGVLRRMPEITLFANPIPNSYKRLGFFEAPDVVSWSRGNRSTLVRVPSARGMDSRMEIRSADCATNPYVLLTLVLRAGFEGMDDQLALPPEFRGDALSAPGVRLPASLGEAIEAAEGSAFVRASLPEKLVESFIGLKRKELQDWEEAGDKAAFEFRRYFLTV